VRNTNRKANSIFDVCYLKIVMNQSDLCDSVYTAQSSTNVTVCQAVPTATQIRKAKPQSQKCIMAVWPAVRAVRVAAPLDFLTFSNVSCNEWLNLATLTTGQLPSRVSR
jgi:hypothetical protein